MARTSYILSAINCLLGVKQQSLTSFLSSLDEIEVLFFNRRGDSIRNCKVWNYISLSIMLVPSYYMIAATTDTQIKSMARTSYILSAISWREQVTFCQLYHGENKLHFVSYIMTRTSYILSAI
jgi:hypothetical protein